MLELAGVQVIRERPQKTHPWWFPVRESLGSFARFDQGQSDLLLVRWKVNKYIYLKKGPFVNFYWGDTKYNPPRLKSTKFSAPPLD